MVYLETQSSSKSSWWHVHYFRSSTYSSIFKKTWSNHHRIHHIIPSTFLGDERPCTLVCTWEWSSFIRQLILQFFLDWLWWCQNLWRSIDTKPFGKTIGTTTIRTICPERLWQTHLDWSGTFSTCWIVEHFQGRTKTSPI